MKRSFLKALGCFALIVSSPVRAGESSSASYRLVPSTANAGGEAATSTSFALNASAAQEATVGTSASPGFVLQSGFWSFVGSGLVPVQLMVNRNAVTPGNVDLAWSGNNAPYAIFESTDCTTVFSSMIDSTSSNNYDDVTPPSATIVCYNVLATAPGPAPLP